MLRRLYTIGFTGKTAQEFFALLAAARVKAVLDIRLNRGGQLSAFAKFPDLRFFLKEVAGIDYFYEPAFAPSPELLKAYRLTKDWAAYEAAFSKLMKKRKAPQSVDTAAWPSSVALLCSEPGPEKCHRRLVADLLAEYWRKHGDQVEVRHLMKTSEAPKQATETVPLAPTPKHSRIKPSRGTPQENDRFATNAHKIESTPFAKSVAPDSAATPLSSSVETEILPGPSALLVGCAVNLGSRVIASEEIDRAFDMPEGKLRNRAGIVSVAHAAADENELSLGSAAATRAMDAAGIAAKDLDWILATSETHRAYPSLAAQLHKRLHARESCGALDLGGACLGLLNALATAQSLISSGESHAVVIVTADLHSRTLTPKRVAGEFGGLFGDGASAFVLRRGPINKMGTAFRLAKFFFGCAAQYSEAISVTEGHERLLEVHFDGEALSRAAITRMEKVLAAVEDRSGINRHRVAAFATHQPNPRLVTLLAKQLGVSADKFPAIARTAGNLGSSTCGAALVAALEKETKFPPAKRKPIFLASLGPGLLFGGGWLIPVNSKFE